MNHRDFNAYTALRDTAHAAPPARVDRAVLAAARLAVRRQRQRRLALRGLAAAAVIGVVWVVLASIGAPVSLIAFPIN